MQSEISVSIGGANCPAKSRIAEAIQDILLTYGAIVHPDRDHGALISAVNRPPAIGGVVVRIVEVNQPVTAAQQSNVEGNA